METQASQSSNANGSRESGDGGQRDKYYARLFRKFVLLTLLSSLTPLLLVGWGINVYYTRFAKDRMLNDLQTQVANHRKIIELFLAEHRSKLHLIAHSHSKNDLTRISNLTDIFDMINRDYWAITDLGIIDADGSHLAYIGPYDLMNKNYSDSYWFKEVMQKDIYISDMFMGFRREPHFVIAVTRLENGAKWILRATVNTEVFRSLVENVRIGKTGEVYLLNREGYYQTNPRFQGQIMDKATYPIETEQPGMRVRILESQNVNTLGRRPRQIVCETWLENPKWLLAGSRR